MERTPTGTPVESSGGWQNASFDKNDVLSIAATNPVRTPTPSSSSRPPFGQIEPAAEIGSRATDGRHSSLIPAPVRRECDNAVKTRARARHFATTAKKADAAGAMSLRVRSRKCRWNTEEQLRAG
jgi:hypothetical protein